MASIPQEYQGFSSILGLLGNYNGDSSDDLMYVNGTMIAIDSPYDMVHEFGQSCKLNILNKRFLVLWGTLNCFSLTS